MIELIPTLLVVALAVCGILAAIKWYHTRNEIKQLRKRLKALRERLDCAVEYARERERIASRWVRATETYFPLLEHEVDPAVVEEMKDDLETDKQTLETEDQNDQ